jgi:predicted aspartyl protease
MKLFIIFSNLMLLNSISAQADGFKFKVVRDAMMGPDHIETDMQFDGHTGSCLVDTGARYTVAKEHLLQDNVKVGETVGGGISGMNNVTDLVESDVTVGSWSNPQSIIGRIKPELLPADCLLGNDFFLKKEFSINFKENSISDETTFNGPVYPLDQFLSDRGGHFGFKIGLGNEEVSTLFDTGATDSVFDIDFVIQHQSEFEFIKEIPIQDGSNQTIKAGVYKAKSIRFGSVIDRDVRVYVVSLKSLQSKIPGIQAILGLNQMMRHKWYVNNKKAVWGLY